MLPTRTAPSTAPILLSMELANAPLLILTLTLPLKHASLAPIRLQFGTERVVRPVLQEVSIAINTKTVSHAQLEVIGVQTSRSVSYV